MEYEALRKRIQEVIKENGISYADIARGTGRLDGSTKDKGMGQYSYMHQVLTGAPGQKSRPVLEDVAEWLEAKGHRVRSRMLKDETL